MAKSNLKERRDEIEALVKKIQNGDQQAFSDLYNIFIDPIFRYVFYRVKKEDAEDIVETVFLRVWENIRQYKPRKKAFSAWVFRIAHNLVVDYYRAEDKRNVEELNDWIPDDNRQHNPIKDAKNYLDQKNLKMAMKNLKKNYQEIIIYKFINDFSNKEIAEIINKSEGSIRILQYRALKALKKELLKLGIKYDV